MNYKKIIFSLCVGAAAMSACTDTWDEHYNSLGEGEAATQNLWEIINDDPELKEFARVMKATHFDRDLQSGQMLSIWAAPITAEEADRWIATYNADHEAGIKDEDNKAIIRFVQNHVCMYNRTVSSLTKNDTVKMLNGKYKYLSYESLDDAKMTVKNKLATNGVFYKINSTLPFFNNIYEELLDNPKVNRFGEFLKSYNEYELDEGQSVPGEIIDGKIHYLDSVTVMTNIFMRGYDAMLNREDSSYIILAPTNEVFDAQYERYSNYFRYPPLTVNRDSLQDVRTKQAIFCSRVFNINPEVNPEMAKEDEQSRDSLMSTNYSMSRWEDYVYYKPFVPGGLLDGKEKVECSNGYVYIDNNDATVDPKHTFMSDDKASATARWIYGKDDESPDQYGDREKLKQNLVSIVSTRVSDSIMVDSTLQRLHLYGDRYVIFSGTANNSTSTEFSYSLPSIMSDLYYNVYFVFPPACAENDPYRYEDDGLAVKFRAYLHEMDVNGTLSKGTGTSTRIMDPETGARDLTSIAGVVDTMCILRGHQFNYTGWGNDHVAWIYFTSYVSNSENQKTYTRRIRVNAILLRAFETKEAAEADYAAYLESRNKKK